MVFSFEWKKNPNEWLGMMQGNSPAELGQMKQDAIQQNLNAAGYDDFAAADAAQLANAGYGEAAIAQNLGAAGVAQDPEFLASDAANLNESVGQNIPDAGGFDLGAITDSLGKLGGGGDDFKFNKPNMQLMKVGGNSQGYQSMAPQAVQPLSTAMGAITSPQQTMAAAGQPQQDEQINMMRRMLGLA
jgi:hypothetical protein